jgi:hypothetical protein
MNLQEQRQQLEQAYQIKKQIKLVLVCPEENKVYLETLWQDEPLLIYETGDRQSLVLTLGSVILFALENHSEQLAKLEELREQLYLAQKTNINELEMSFSIDQGKITVSGY